MSGYLVEITMLLDWFKVGRLNEKQLEYALWIYEPTTRFNNLLWQMKMIHHVDLPRISYSQYASLL